MKKTSKIVLVIAVIAIFVIIGVAIFLLNSKSKSNLEQINTVEDLVSLVNKVYEGQGGKFSSIQTQIIDITDNDMVKYCTGLENNKDLEYLVVSEPMMSSQAYSLVIAKVKTGVNANALAKIMCDSINIRKWICVSAEKVYATSSKDVVFLVMSNEEMAKTVYESFKSLAGSVGEEYERTEEEIELPEEMY